MTEINTQGPVRPRSLAYLQCVGSCHAYLTLRQDWRELSALVQKSVGFRSCRFHGIFHDLVGTCSRDGEGRIRTNFVNVDKIYQGLLDLGMKPFIELGFMPFALASGDQTCFVYKANVTPPRDYAEWAQFIRDFVEHLITRFGRQEVLTWHFEVWNEPDLSYFWKDADQAEYFKLYAVTAAAIKGVEPGLRVGGPATSNNQWVPEMLAYCEENEVPLDFISTHHYCSDAALELGVPEGQIAYLGQKKMQRDVARVRALIDASAFPQAELHYTEWNVSPAHNDRYGKDSEFTMTFILQTLRDLGDLPDSYSFWTINDIFEESGPGDAPFSGKYGLVNLYGVKKPAFHAYAFLSALYATELAAEHPHLVATTAAGSYRLLAWNHCEPVTEDYNGADWEIAEETLAETILLRGAAGRYRIRAWQVDKEKGNGLRAWQAMGSPQYPTPEQNAALAQAAEPVLVRDDIVSAEQDLELTHQLPPNALIYYDIAKA